MTSMLLRSTSRAEDAGYFALADVATVAGRLDVDYRLIGGHMVTLLVALHGATGVPARETSDADLGVEFSVVADPNLLAELAALGYRSEGAANRFARPLPDDLSAVIDVLAPSFTGRHEPSQRHGDLVVDEIPGLLLALGLPPVVIDLQVELMSGETLDVAVRLPSPLSALCLKLLAWESRLAVKDEVDIWRLLEVCAAAGVQPASWHEGTTQRHALAGLLRFVRPGSPALRRLTPDQRVQARIRAVAQRIAPSDL